MTEYKFYLVDELTPITKTLDNRVLLRETKLNDNIVMKLAEDKEITIQSKVSLKSLDNFIDYAIKQTLDGFNINNFIDFILLYDELIYDKKEEGYQQFK